MVELTDTVFLTLMLEAAVPAGILSMLVMRFDEALSSSHMLWFGYRAMLLALLFGGFWGILVGSRVFPRMARRRGFWPAVVVLEALWLVGISSLVF
ncbi:MAG TPA: hypothetical protein VLY65_00490 [Nitrososphaerales archaeon]|nr:hypothetical protein [Nitrososphaerales archaeon]